MLSQSVAKCIVLTEDSIKRSLEVLLESSGFRMRDTLVLAYYGCTSPHNLRPLLDLIRASNRSAKIVVHQDRDYLTDEESTAWETEIRKMSVEPFLTNGVDIESHFLDAEYLADLNHQPVSDMIDLINHTTDVTRDLSIEKYVNGRADIARKNGTFGRLNMGQLATQAPKIFAENPERYRHSKTVAKELRRRFQEKQSVKLRLVEVSDKLKVRGLMEIAKKI